MINHENHVKFFGDPGSNGSYHSATLRVARKDFWSKVLTRLQAEPNADEREIRFVKSRAW